MTKTRPWRTAALVALAFAAILAVANWRTLALLYALATVRTIPAPATELFANLPNDYAMGREVLATRLSRRFPVGTPTRDLEAYLQAQGLRPSPAAVEGERNYSAVWGPEICGSLLNVSWRADDQARLANLRVVYGDSGCL